jgi:hypothetical protein
MRFNVKSKHFKGYAVYLDGELQKHAVEADDCQGWVRTEVHHPSVPAWFQPARVERKTRYGRVHIVKMVDYPVDYYRDDALTATKTPPKQKKVFTKTAATSNLPLVFPVKIIFRNDLVSEGIPVKITYRNEGEEEEAEEAAEPSASPVSDVLD